jgi:thiol-disulfide isomerase/thioredoxin
MNGARIFSLLFILMLYPSAGLNAQKVEYIKAEDLERILAGSGDKLYVVNFWATWCGPCVKELPHFQKVAAAYDPSKVSFLLVSLDFPSQFESKLLPFLKKNKITLPVAAMTETDANLWIGKVDQSWQGDIPATLFFNNARKVRKFNAGALDENELRSIIDNLIRT